MTYIFNDEDNAPMNDDAWDGPNSPTFKAENPLPFTDPPVPPDGCWNCREYNGTFCTRLWNNLDECYKETERDFREPEDHCDEWQKDESVKPEDYWNG